MTHRHAPGTQASRVYWACQVAGWGVFTTYVLGWHVAMAPKVEVWRIGWIVLVTWPGCIAASHSLRELLYFTGWLTRRPISIVVPVAGVIAALSLGLTAMAVAPNLLHGEPEVTIAAAAIFGGLFSAFCGWALIYGVAHAVRTRQAAERELELRSRDAQLEALRAQINPHFLFNALNSVRALIVQNPAQAVDAVTALSSLLRYTLAVSMRKTVDLGEELRVVDEYLAIEQMRFEQRLTVKRSVDPVALSALIPPLLLQTLVENAITHGIATREQGGAVELVVTAPQGYSHVVVSNPGILVSESHRDHHGLANATARLRLLCGPATSLTVESRGECVRTTVVLPRSS